MGVLSAFKSAGPYSHSHLFHAVKYRMSKHLIYTKTRIKTANAAHRALLRAKEKNRASKNGRSRFKSDLKNKPHLFTTRMTALDSVTQLLRLKLIIDQYNYDDIAIGFNSGASPTYDYNEDSRYLPGIDAPEGLSCFSSDGVPLSVNFLPLPKQTPDVIRLDVEAENSGQFNLKRTELDSLPKIYDLWLVDNYKKDSLDLRVDSNYFFNIDKTDTASFGSYRFKVVVRQNPALGLHLLSFNATKAPNGAQIAWTTENEENYTNFSVERSSDGGVTFSALGTIQSSGAGSYSFTDKTPPAASDEYRVKITDLNSNVTYTNAVTLIYGNNINTITGNISIYPNPANNTLNLTINQTGSGSPTNIAASQGSGSPSSLAASATTAATSYNIKIINVGGSVIQTGLTSTATWQDNVAKLSPGTYIITVVSSKDNKLVGKSTFVKL
jgi:hypothetical protein